MISVVPEQGKQVVNPVTRSFKSCKFSKVGQNTKSFFVFVLKETCSILEP